jgi:hypothetical protein
MQRATPLAGGAANDALVEHRLEPLLGGQPAKLGPGTRIWQ